MNIVIPLAGIGSRFSQKGYKDIKPLIPVNGVPMIQRAIESLDIDGYYIFIMRKFEGWERVKEILVKIKPYCKVIILDEVTQGPACTSLVARDYINNDSQLIITNCDQVMHWRGSDFNWFCYNNLLDGGVVTYNSTSDKNSYVKLNDKGHGVLFKEKEVISTTSLVGIHYWKRGRNFVSSAEEMIAKNDRANNGEFYVAPTYNYMPKGSIIGVFHLPDGVYNSVGSPKDLEDYESRRLI